MEEPPIRHFGWDGCFASVTWADWRRSMRPSWRGVSPSCSRSSASAVPILISSFSRAVSSEIPADPGERRRDGRAGGCAGQRPGGPRKVPAVAPASACQRVSAEIEKLPAGVDLACIELIGFFGLARETRTWRAAATTSETLARSERVSSRAGHPAASPCSWRLSLPSPPAVASAAFSRVSSSEVGPASSPWLWKATMI